MTYSDQWKALSARIHGLAQAGQQYAVFLSVNNQDIFATHFLSKQCRDIVSAIELFRDQFQQLLSPIALKTITKFLNKAHDVNTTGQGHQAKFLSLLIMLTAFESEMSFVLSDVQEAIRSRSERAFSHLQRLIVVDAEVREKWKQAFGEGEVECEKLGAVHLLWHGIWAFKVNATGERTDLVFQQPEGDFADAQRYVEGFVLTEWKKADATNVDKKFEEARNQTKCYAQGALAGSELTGYQYAIIVSERQVAVPKDVMLDEVVYRHINIAVNPLSPSRRR